MSGLTDLRRVSIVIAALAGASFPLSLAAQARCTVARLDIDRATPARIVASRANFHRGEDRRGCPAAGAACRERAYVVRGDPIIVTGGGKAFACAVFVGVNGGERIGWIERKAIAFGAGAVPPLPGWVGTWRGPEREAVLKLSGGGSLSVSGSATWGGGDPDRVARGAIHTGELDGAMRPIGARATYADGPGDDACQVRFRRVGAYLLAADNLRCGGVNVSFGGVYRRGGRS